MSDPAAFQARSPCHAIAATTTASPPEQITPSGTSEFETYFVVNDSSSKIAITIAPTNATSAAFPVPGTPLPFTFIIEAGVSHTLSGPPRAWVSVLATLANAGTVYVVGGEGVAGGSAGSNVNVPGGVTITNDPIGVKGDNGSTIASINNPFPTEIVVGGADIDPRAIRALTDADEVTSDQGDPNAGGTASWPVQGAVPQAGSVASVNPVLLGAVGPTGSMQQVHVDVAGSFSVAQSLSGGSIDGRGPTVQGLSDSTNNYYPLAVYPWFYDPNTGSWDRLRGTANGLILQTTAAAANILSGSATANGAFLTVPANKTWRGSVMACLSALANPGAAGGSFQVRVVWAPGTGGTPAYDVVRAQSSISQVLLTSLIGENSNAEASLSDVILYAGTTAGTLSLVITGGPNQSFGSASGVIENAT